MQAIRVQPSPMRCSTARRGAADVVDVDARCLDPGQPALEDDRESVVSQLEQAVVVEARAGHDDPVGVLGPQQRIVGAMDRVERLDHHPEAGRPGSRRQAAEGLGQGGVAGDLLGRLAEDEAEDVAHAAGQTPGRCVGVVAQLGRGHEDALARRHADVRPRSVVEDEGHGRARHARPSRHISTRGSPA